MVTRQTLTYYTHNQLKTFQQCKRRYYYEYVKRLNWPREASNYELGLSVHKLLDYEAKGLDTTIFLNSMKEDIRELWGHLQGSNIVKYPVVASEWAFNIKLKETDYWLEGRLDRIIKLPKEEKYIIVDFKTGQKIPNHTRGDWQATVYLYATSEAMSIEPENLEFWYYRVDKEPEVRKISYNSEMHATYYKKIKDQIREIENATDWNADEKCQNKFCQYGDLCKKDLLA